MKLPRLDRGRPNARDFIDDSALESLLGQAAPPLRVVEELVDKACSKEVLSVEETALLLAAEDREAWDLITAGAKALKREVYGDRMVLFSPLYVGNLCVNDCSYCAFRRSNDDAARGTLRREELAAQARSLLDRGHKRLIVVFGEHPDYGAEMIAESVRTIYDATGANGDRIRRLNVNAAPLDTDGFAQVRDSGIGTYQVFQETYHHPTYEEVHPASTRKGKYLWRLDAANRAFEAGLDDFGIGALFGLYDWRFEVLGLVSHALHLQTEYGCGPHTVSVPRLRPALGVRLDPTWLVSDRDFLRLIAVLRLAIPYTGLIVTAREEENIRRQAVELGISQLDAGSNIALGGYDATSTPNSEQFSLGDDRELDAVIAELLEMDHIPSFCTACYRLKRTGEHFMEFAVPGFIKRFCTPNGLLTLTEYLIDYASPSTRQRGMELVDRKLLEMEDSTMKTKLVDRLRRVRDEGARDLYF